MERRNEMVDQKINESIVGDDNKIYFPKARSVKNSPITISQLPNEWKEYVDAKFQKQYEEIKPLLENVYAAVISSMENVAAKIANERCLHDNNVKGIEDIAISLNEMKQHEEEVFGDIQKILKDQSETDNRVAALQELNERLQLDTRKTLVCCEEILTQIRWGNEHIEELATLVKENSKGIAKIGDKVGAIDDKVESLKEIVLSFLQFAEKQHEEYQSARAVMKQRYEELSSPGLDAQTIADMHEWLQELSGKSVEKIRTSIDEKHEELVQKIKEIGDELKVIEKLVADYGEAQKEGQKKLEEQLSQKAEEILRREAELYGLVVNVSKKADHIIETTDDTNELVNRVVEMIHEILQRGEGLEKIMAGLKSEQGKAEINPKEVERLQKQIKTISLENENLSRARDYLLELTAILQNNGKQVFHNESCPFCCVEEERPTLGTQCECLVCGNIFTIGEPIDPNMSDISDERVREDARQWENHRQHKREKNESDGEKWRIQHTAVLEKVSENKYRMRIPSRVGDDGILIIPSETKYPEQGGEAVKQIDFCQPNTDDEEGRKRLSQVKKLFLDDGIEIDKFNGIVPFSEIKELEKVMKWDGNGFIEDKGTLEKIKGRVANDA